MPAGPQLLPPCLEQLHAVGSAHMGGAYPPEVFQETSQLECNGLVHLPQRQMLHFSAEGSHFQIESRAPKLVHLTAQQGSLTAGASELRGQRHRLRQGVCC